MAGEGGRSSSRVRVIGWLSHVKKELLAPKCTALLYRYSVCILNNVQQKLRFNLKHKFNFILGAPVLCTALCTWVHSWVHSWVNMYIVMREFRDP